jgi:NTP pyrophosphatase (non-canonical NTP hydrolase)
MNRETSASIAVWGTETFGPVSDLAVLTRRARAEFDELEAALASADAAHIAEEAADVVILLHRLVGLLQRDLASEIDAKMDINRKRQWRPSGDGVGQHT